MSSGLGGLPSILDKLPSLGYTMPMTGKQDHSPTLRNRLKVARAERGLSQEGLAALAGVTRQTISSIETGQYVPSALLAFLLADRLGMPVDGLFYLDGGGP